MFTPLETPVTHILPIDSEGSRQVPALPPRSGGLVSPELTARLPPLPGPWASLRWTERAAGSLPCLQTGFWCALPPGGCVHPLLSASFFSSPPLISYCYESFSNIHHFKQKGKEKRPTPAHAAATGTRRWPSRLVGARAPPAPPSLLTGSMFPTGPFFPVCPSPLGHLKPVPVPEAPQLLARLSRPRWTDGQTACSLLRLSPFPLLLPLPPLPPLPLWPNNLWKENGRHPDASPSNLGPPLLEARPGSRVSPKPSRRPRTQPPPCSVNPWVRVSFPPLRREAPYGFGVGVVDRDFMSPVWLRLTPSCFPRTLTHGRFGGQAGCLAGRPSLETLGCRSPSFPSPVPQLQRLDEGRVDVLIDHLLSDWHRIPSPFKVGGSLPGTLTRPLCCARSIRTWLVPPCCGEGPGAVLSQPSCPRAQARDPSPQGPPALLRAGLPSLP